MKSKPIYTIDYKKVIQKYLRKHLKQNGLDESSIKRITEDDLPYLTEWLLKPNTLKELKDGKAYVLPAFGYGPKKKGVVRLFKNYNPKTYKPGKSNEAIAQIVATLYGLDIKRPIFAQWEIAEALKKYNIIVPEKNIAKPKRGYLGTAGDIEQWMDNGLKTYNSVILVTHPYYAYRPKEIIQSVSEKRSQKIKVLVADTSAVPFDQNSVQAWTRNLKSWVRYEVCNRFSNRYRGNMGRL